MGFFARRFRRFMNLGTVLGGAITRNVLRGVFKILIAGVLGPAALGVVRSIYSLFRIVTRLTDLGLDYAAVTLCSAALARDNAEESRRTFGTILTLKLVIGLGVLVIGNALAAQVTPWLLGDPRLETFARLAFLAVGGQLLWKYMHSHFWAHRRFRSVALFLTTVPLLMLAVFGVLRPLGLFSIDVAALLYLFAPAVTVALWWFLAGRDLVRVPTWSRAVAGNIIRFSRWIYASSMVSATRADLNPLLLKNPSLSGSIAAGEVATGLYGFGADLASEITLFSQSLTTVLLPEASAKRSPESLLRFVKRAYLHLVPLLIPLVLLVFAAEPLILLLAWVKESYLEFLPAAAAFKPLFLAGLVSVATIPIQTALYAARLPHMETYVELGTVVILIGGSLWLIPLYGSVGAALAVLAQRTTAGVILVVWGIARLRRMP